MKITAEHEQNEQMNRLNVTYTENELYTDKRKEVNIMEETTKKADWTKLIKIVIQVLIVISSALAGREQGKAEAKTETATEQNVQK